MNCYYCDKITEFDASYKGRKGSYDLGSAAPRCSWHWRYRCAQCGHVAHFMAMSFCPDQGELFCTGCSQDQEEIANPFWAWKYYYSYRSPWSGRWLPALDRLEYEGQHPLQQADQEEKTRAALDQEPYLTRYPIERSMWPADQDWTDARVQINWNQNAERWAALYDEDGDLNRRYMSDEPMLAMLGEVRGLRVLDVGSGNGYLCRKLARQGALMTGVELSDQFMDMAIQHEKTEPLGITYHLGSASEMSFLPRDSFDKVVSNYVLMDVPDYIGVLEQISRVLRPGGIFVAVISHPCFSCGPGGWVTPAPDSPRHEDRYALQVDNYFHRGPYFTVWGNFDPVIGFHRPLRDYWQAFREAGFAVEGFEEPSITERGRRELPPSRVEYSQRITYSCIFQLRK